MYVAEFTSKFPPNIRGTLWEIVIWCDEVLNNTYTGAYTRNLYVDLPIEDEHLLRGLALIKGLPNKIYTPLDQQDSLEPLQIARMLHIKLNIS